MAKEQKARWGPTKTPGVSKWTGPNRRDGAFMVRVYDEGQKKRVSRTFATYQEAVDFKREQERAKAKRRREGRAPDVETVESWARRWLKVAPRPKESTNLHNQGMLKPFVQDFGDRPLASITRAEAHLWINGGPAGPDLAKAAAGWSGAARDEDGDLIVRARPGNLQTLKAFFNDAITREVGGVTENPFAHVKRKARERSMSARAGSMLTKDEVIELSEIAGRLHGPHGRYVVAPLIRVAAYTGLRPGELFALRPEDVDLDRRELHVVRAFNQKTKTYDTPKNHQERTVALLDVAFAAFEALELEKCVQDEPIFRTMRNEPLTQRNLFYYWDPVRKAFAESRPKRHWLSRRLEKLGKRGDLDFYEMRHFFGSYLAELGASPYDIAEQMGHSDGGKLAMETYIKTHSADSRKRIAALEEAAHARKEEAA